MIELQEEQEKELDDFIGDEDLIPKNLNQRERTKSTPMLSDILPKI